MWSNYTGEITLYHYTTEENARRIMNTRVIWKSEDDYRDAILGDGVYLTDLAPHDKSIYEIARNNWDHGAGLKVALGHMDAAIKVKLSKKEVSYMKKKGRYIYLYEGNLPLPESAELIYWDDDKQYESHAHGPYYHSAKVPYTQSSSAPSQLQPIRQESTSGLSLWKVLGGVALGVVAIGLAVAVLGPDNVERIERKLNKK